MSALIFRWICFGSLTLFLCFVYTYSKSQDGRNVAPPPQIKQIGNKQQNIEENYYHILIKGVCPGNPSLWSVPSYEHKYAQWLMQPNSIYQTKYSIYQVIL